MVINKKKALLILLPLGDFLMIAFFKGVFQSITFLMFSFFVQRHHIPIDFIILVITLN